MINRGILYKEVMDLGFKREDHGDSVFLDQNGYEWFTVTKDLRKNLYLNWDCETHEVELIRWKPKGGDILNRKNVTSLKEIKELIEFYTTKNPKKKERSNSYTQAC